MTINRPTPHLPTRRVALAIPALLPIGVCALVAAAALAVQSWRPMAGPSDRPTAAAATAMTDWRVPAGSGLGERPSEVAELSTVVPGREVLEEGPVLVVPLPELQQQATDTSTPTTTSTTSTTTTTTTAAARDAHDPLRGGQAPPVPDTQPAGPAEADTTSPEPPACLTLAVVGAAFAPDSADVSPAVRDALAPYVAQLLASDRPVHVDGHTDRRHTSYPGGNQGLSEDRAAAVAQVLTELGVPFDRLIVAGYADRRPLDEADSLEALATNRRVEINMDC